MKILQQHSPTEKHYFKAIKILNLPLIFQMELVFRRLKSLPDSSEQQQLLDETSSNNGAPEVDVDPELSGMTTDDDDFDDDDES